jgi:hypothetical protein
MSGRYNCVATSSEDAHLYDPTCIEVLRQPEPCALYGSSSLSYNPMVSGSRFADKLA